MHFCHHRLALHPKCRAHTAERKAGPRVPPGAYAATISSVSKKIIGADPKAKYTEEDLEEVMMERKRMDDAEAADWIVEVHTSRSIGCWFIHIYGMSRPRLAFDHAWS